MPGSADNRSGMEQVFGLIEAGEIDHAETRCRALLGKSPEDVNLVALLGAIHMKQNQQAKARATLEQAIAMAPDFAKPYEDLGALCLLQGKSEEATDYFNKALSLDDTMPAAWSGLAAALGQSGRDNEAREAHKRFLEVSPISQGLQQAKRLVDSGQLEEARKLCDELLRQNPNNVDVLRMQATVATADDRSIIAEGLLKRVIKIQPDEARGYVELGTFLGMLKRYPEAVEYLQTAAKMDSSAAVVRQQLGDYLGILGDPAAALENYDAVLELDRNDSAALVGRAHMLRVLGQSADAAQAYEAAIEINPGNGDGWWGLSSLHGYELDESQQDELQRQLAKDTTTPVNKVFLHFAMGRTCEKKEDYDSAWIRYTDGNALKRKMVEYDPVENETLHNDLIKTCTAELLQRDPRGDTEEPTPIFIVGMPRSGSTLLEQILASHSAIEGTSELPYIKVLSESVGATRTGGNPYPAVLADMTEQQLSAVGKSYLYYSKKDRREGKAFFTDKMPVNFQHIGLIHLALPNAKIIDARRHPMDTCVGNFRQLYANGKNYTYDLFECGEYYLEYLRLMQHWNKVLPDRILTVQYEDVVADLEGQSRRILEYCGLPWEDSCLEFHKTDRAVNTVSTDQVRQPIYTGAVGYWKHYEDKLGELKEIFADVLPA